MIHEKERPAKAERSLIDWDRVAIDIRAGILTDRQIGDKYGRSHGAIQQYAKKHGIERDLTDRIHQRTEAKLARAQLAKLASQARGKATQEQVIEIAAEARSTVVIAQQGRIGRHLSVAEALINELESQTINRELYEQLGEIMRSPDKNGVDKLNDLYVKVITTSSRIDSHKKAVETEKVLITLERQAFGLDDSSKGEAETGVESLIKAVMAKNGE